MSTPSRGGLPVRPGTGIGEESHVSGSSIQLPQRRKPPRFGLGADGTSSPLALSVKILGLALVAGQSCPFAGNVSMDLITVDVTDVPENEIVLMTAAGERPVARAPKEEIAAAVLDEVERLLKERDGSR